MNRLLSIVALTAMTLATHKVVAQDKPYAPRPADAASLIQPDSFPRIPVVFPYPEISQRQVVDGERYDFEIVLDVPYEDLVADFEEAFKTGKIMVELEEGMYPNAKDPKLMVIGRGDKPDGTQRYTLGNRNIPFRIAFDIRPDGERTIVVIQNRVWSLLHSGIMPARVGYKPVDGNEVRFRYN